MSCAGVRFHAASVGVWCRIENDDEVDGEGGPIGTVAPGPNETIELTRPRRLTPASLSGAPQTRPSVTNSSMTATQDVRRWIQAESRVGEGLPAPQDGWASSGNEFAQVRSASQPLVERATLLVPPNARAARDEELGEYRFGCVGTKRGDQIAEVRLVIPHE